MIISGTMEVHQVEKGKVKFKLKTTDNLYSTKDVIVDDSFLPKDFDHETHGIRGMFMFKFSAYPK